MKTIKSIRKTKEVELGEIRRVDDKTAHNMVGYSWEYISKSEWKSSRGIKSEQVQEKNDTETKSVKTRKKSK